MLGFIDRYESVIANVGYERIERVVKEMCEGNWEKAMLADVRWWVQENVMPWLLAVYGRGAPVSECAAAAVLPLLFVLGGLMRGFFFG